ncbi:MAG TPA: FHA domain-containing protein [Planctomycetota bacterium]|nr:FHA domain-containing protein [Planctomycetota bacterium]
MAKLIVTSPEGRKSERELEGTLIVGRAQDCSLRLASDTKASRNHCKIEKRGSEYALSDMGSANGTRLNGEKIGQRIEVLKDGDVVVVGGTKLEFVDGSGGAAAPAAPGAAAASPGGGLLGKVKGALGGLFSRGGGSGGEGGGEGAGGAVFGDKTITCPCGAVLSTAAKSPGQKVGCPRCKKIYAVPGK